MPPTTQLEREEANISDSPSLMESSQRARSAPGKLTPRHVLRLQQAVGNGAVQRVLARSRIGAPAADIQREGGGGAGVGGTVELREPKDKSETGVGYSSVEGEGSEGAQQFFEKSEETQKKEDRVKVKLIEITLPEQEFAGGQGKVEGKAALEEVAKGAATVKVTFEKGGHKSPEMASGPQVGHVKGQQIDYQGKMQGWWAWTDSPKQTHESELEAGWESGAKQFGAKGKHAAAIGLGGSMEGEAGTTFAHDTQVTAKGKGEGALKGEVGGSYGLKASAKEWSAQAGLKGFAGFEATGEAELSIKSGGTEAFKGKVKGGMTYGIGGEVGGLFSWGEGGELRLAGKAKFAAGLGLSLEYDLTINPIGMGKLGWAWGVLGSAWEWTKWGGSKLASGGAWLLGY